MSEPLWGFNWGYGGSFARAFTAEPAIRYKGGVAFCNRRQWSTETGEGLYLVPEYLLEEAATKLPQCTLNVSPGEVVVLIGPQLFELIPAPPFPTEETDHRFRVGVVTYEIFSEWQKQAWNHARGIWLEEFRKGAKSPTVQAANAKIVLDGVTPPDVAEDTAISHAHATWEGDSDKARRIALVAADLDHIQPKDLEQAVAALWAWHGKAKNLME